MERKILNAIRHQLDEILSQIPDLSVRQSKKGLAREKRPDLLLEVQHGGTKVTLVVEFKTTGQPGTIHRVAEQLKKYVGDNETLYPVLGVPYITDRGIETCREEGIGCIDTIGNCLLRFGSIYIEVRGNPNPYPVSREIKSLFSPKSSRVARVLLSDVGRWWRVREMATIAEVNPGLVSRLKKQFVESAFATEQQAAIRADALSLLTAWSDNYSYRRNELAEFYSLDNRDVLEQKLVDYAARTQCRWAMSLFSGAAHVAPHVRMNKLFAYVDCEPEVVAQALEMKQVGSGANVTLMRPYDAGVFLFSREIEGIPVVSDIQLYLDLKSYRGRGAEAADFLLEHTIQPEWQREVNTSRQK